MLVNCLLFSICLCFLLLKIFKSITFFNYGFHNLCFWLLQTSSFFLHIFKVQFTERKVQIGGKQPSNFYLATITCVLIEQVPFAAKDLAV